MFAAFGTLTDCSLKFTKEGKFRKFGFVGFRSEEEAGTALKHFNKSFVDTARITVECCKPFGDATKAKAWSKHSRKSVSTEGKEPGQQKEAAAVKKLKEDQDFKEFLAVHQNRAQVPTWANDTLTEPKKNKEQDEKKKKAATDYLNFDSDQSSEEEEEESTERTGRETGLSDMDYLRSKVVSEREEESEEEESAADRKPPPQADSAYESGDKGTAQTLTDKKKGKQNQTEPTTPYTVKLRGAPFNVKEQQVQEFLVPLKPVAIRIVRNVHGNKTGSIFVDLKSEDEVLKALQRNKDYLGGRYIEVFRAKAAPAGRPEKRGGEEKDWRRQLKEDEEEEEVSESGRLFVRNLPYTCSEEDISGLFSKYVSKTHIYSPLYLPLQEARGSVAVRMALGETQIVQETRQFLLDNKVSLDSFSQALGPRSGTVILVKNLPAGVQGPELEAVFAPFGSLGRVLLPPAGLTAIVEFLEPTEAKRAFTKLAYTKFQHVPLYLEWAPMDVFSGPLPNSVQKQEPLSSPALEVKETKPESSGEGGSEEEEEEEESQPGCTLFIKNLNFTTTEDTLRQAFSKCGALRSCSISKKKDRSGNMLSMGYGFVEFKKAESAQKALRQLQHCMVEEHQLELKLSERATKATVTSVRKKQQSKKQTSSKILVRNVPFQASVREVRELFRYAQLFITLLKEEQYYLYSGALSTPPLSSARIVQPVRALWQLEVHHGICSPQTALKYSTEALIWMQVHTFPNILCTQLFVHFV
ncbi:UNVERIFIED_CONTAM: hypothetical protein FKN15_030048 [Acipenser sinensis]